MKWDRAIRNSSTNSYTERHWGFDQAERHIREIWRHISIIATNPTSGRPCPEVRAGYYKYRTGSHFLFCHMTSNGVDVVRILHERMDRAAFSIEESQEGI
jgi:toxin ParE1/3/4